MRLLMVGIVAAVTLWGGYWYFGSSAVERGLANWFEARQAEGWQADYGAIETAGFPNRFDTTISDLNLADPDTGVAWTMPFFQILTLSYTPNHIVVVFPDEQFIANPVERLTLLSDTMRGSVVFEPNTSLALDRSSFELAGLDLSSSEGWSTTVESGQVATRQNGGPDSHDIYFSASEMRPSQPLLDLIDPRGSLPVVFQGVTLDLTASFDAAWDRFALEERRPQPTAIALRLFSADWGELTFQATGEVTVDDLGVPSGEISLRAKNWKDMLQIAVDSGLIGSSTRPTIENMLGVLAGLSGNPNTIDAPLTFRDGRAYMAGLPIGPAPRLVLY